MSLTETGGTSTVLSSDIIATLLYKFVFLPKGNI